MNPEQYYTKDDHPSSAARGRMWKNISAKTQIPAPVLSIRDRRSFLYGMAASFLLILSVAGLISIVEKTMNANQPVEVRFDNAYRSAIAEFEDVLPSITSPSTTNTQADFLKVKQQQLDLIDQAIRDLRSSIARTDLSPVKQSRLRQLYSLKLQVLQDLLEHGDTRS